MRESLCQLCNDARYAWQLESPVLILIVRDICNTIYYYSFVILITITHQPLFTRGKEYRRGVSDVA
jgi:hypothetical protein